MVVPMVWPQRGSSTTHLCIDSKRRQVDLLSEHVYMTIRTTYTYNYIRASITVWDTRVKFQVGGRGCGLRAEMDEDLVVLPQAPSLAP